MFKEKKTEKRSKSEKSIGRKAKFELFAPDAREVSLVGNFNQWNTLANPMKKDRKGMWKATLSLETGRYEYRFFADGNWENDPSCSCCVANEFGGENCVKIVA